MICKHKWNFAKCLYDKQDNLFFSFYCEKCLNIKLKEIKERAPTAEEILK